MGAPGVVTSCTPSPPAAEHRREGFSIEFSKIGWFTGVIGRLAAPGRRGLLPLTTASPAPGLEGSCRPMAGGGTCLGLIRTLPAAPPLARACARL